MNKDSHLLSFATYSKKNTNPSGIRGIAGLNLLFKERIMSNSGLLETVDTEDENPLNSSEIIV